MILNESANKMFDCSVIDDVQPDSDYSVRNNTDPYGRDYYCTGDFCGLDESIKEDCDLSWLEWDGNEVRIDNEISDDAAFLFRKTVGIMKGWQAQLNELCPDGRFAILTSYDDGSALTEGSEPGFGFTLRFWKIREGQGPDLNVEYDGPVIRWISG